MTTLNLSDLEAKARAAQEEAPGPWRVDLLGSDGVDGVYGTVPVGDDDRPPKIIETDSGFYPPSLPVAAHIAAASPDVVLELVARVRELEAGLDEAVTWLDDLAYLLLDGTSDAEAARTKLDRLRQLARGGAR